MTGPKSLSAISPPIVQSYLFSFHDPSEQSSNMITQVRVIRFLGLKNMLGMCYQDHYQKAVKLRGHLLTT